MKSELFTSTPWDAKTFNIDTYEIIRYEEEVFKTIHNMPGHFTIKVDPLEDKKLLHKYGFYYCDTLLEPYCKKDKMTFFSDEAAGISCSAPIDKLVAISNGAYTHGRFHRDFNLSKPLADLRYDNWLRDLHERGGVFALTYKNEIAGFFGTNGNLIVLHALSDQYKGRGLAKFFWSAACMHLFDQGHEELKSSISATNLSVLNLYASLGFKFRNPHDVYHKLNS